MTIVIMKITNYFILAEFLLTDVNDNDCNKKLSIFSKSGNLL